jgi:hypothetical protein
MYRCATKQGAFAWVAMLALLFSLLAPSAHHIDRPAPAKSEVSEICTRDGVKLFAIAQSAQTNSGEEPGTAPSRHCSYCASLGTTFAGTPSPLALWLADALQTHALPLLYLAPVTPFPWTVAFSRAPPALASVN